MTTAYELIATAMTVPLEVGRVVVSDFTPKGSIVMELRIPKDDVETGAFAVLFAIGALSFEEARPSGIDVDANDRWTVEDFVALRILDGHLMFAADCVRGRRMKTTAEVAPDGAVRLRVVNGASSAPRWITTLSGGMSLAHLSEMRPAGPFYAPSGAPIETIDDWRTAYLARHWTGARSATLLARSWASARGFPDAVSRALGSDERLRGLNLKQALVEHGTRVPGDGGASKTDILVFARDLQGLEVTIAVEGKVSEAFGNPIGAWLTGGIGAYSTSERGERVERLLTGLGVNPKADWVEHLPDQLVHRAWSAVHEAAKRRAPRAVCLVHSFVDADAEGCPAGGSSGGSPASWPPAAPRTCGSASPSGCA